MNKAIAGIAAAGVIGTGGVVGTDAVVLDEVKIDERHTIATEQVEVKQIGNVVETDMPWKGEDGLRVKYDMGTPTLSERLADKRKAEVITETVDFGDGGFKIDVLLNEKPDTNRFCYQIEGHENYDFLYQAPLWQEAGFPAANKECTDTDCDGSHRPEDIVGSYAVYHKTLANHRTGGENYATGKVMHIPRPEVWEVGNKEATKEWAELEYDEKIGELCVVPRPEFTENANYTNGVRIDPTFGYTTAGASGIVQGDDFLWNFVVDALTEDGTLDSMSAYVDASGNFLMALYDGNDLVAGSAETNGSGSASWETANVSGSPSISSGLDRIMFYTDTNYTHYYDTVAGGYGLVFQGRTYDSSLPDPASFSTTPFTATRKFSIYATYTASATEADPPPVYINIKDADVRVKDADLRIKQ